MSAHSVQTGSQTALAHIDEEATSADAEYQQQQQHHSTAVQGDVLSEHYWRDQAEHHRLELERHLRQNEKLHNIVQQLKLRLSNANQQLDDSKELVEVLTEMLEEDETATGEAEEEEEIGAAPMDVVSADEDSSQDAANTQENISSPDADQ